MKCKRCGYQHSSKEKECPNCGYNRFLRKCQSCGKLISMNATKCPYCGHSYSSAGRILLGVFLSIIGFAIAFYAAWHWGFGR